MNEVRGSVSWISEILVRANQKTGEKMKLVYSRLILLKEWQQAGVITQTLKASTTRETIRRRYRLSVGEAFGNISPTDETNLLLVKFCCSVMALVTKQRAYLQRQLWGNTFRRSVREAVTIHPSKQGF